MALKQINLYIISGFVISEEMKELQRVQVKQKRL